MNREEIKECYSMRDILARYGLQPNRAGLIRCPFHTGDREPSMKIYKKDFHCFGCGANGDIFTFVQRIEQVSFKEAFRILGGEYRHDTAARFSLYHVQKRREMEQKQTEKRSEERRMNVMRITIYRRWIRRLAPYSDAWCACQNELVREIGRFEEWNGLR